MVKKKGGPITKYRKNRLMKDLETLFLNGSIKYHSIRDLSLKFDIAKDTVSKYLDEIRLKIDPKDIQVTQIKFKSLFEEAIKTCEYLVQTAMEERREKDARDSIRLLLLTIKEQTDFMERFFVKQKAVDNINLKADIKQTSVNIQIIDDRTQVIDNGVSTDN